MKHTTRFNLGINQSQMLKDVCALFSLFKKSIMLMLICLCLAMRSREDNVSQTVHCCGLD